MMKYLLLLLLLFFSVADAIELKKFKPLKECTLSDYNFDWDIRYFEIVSFSSKPSDGKHFELNNKAGFLSIAKYGIEVPPKKRDIALNYISKALMKSDYFWKVPMPPIFFYNFYTILFLKKADPHFQAVSELKDVKDMLGDIDTPQELYLWLYIRDDIYSFRDIEGYKKTKNGYRVYYKGINPFTCIYKEYYKEYDKNGYLLHSDTLKEYREKDCAEAII